MPKKKKGAKKGGKKKGGAKKTKSSEPKLTQAERFIQFSTQTRTDQLNIWQTRRNELLENSSALRVELASLQKDCNRVVNDLKTQVDGGEQQVSSLQDGMNKELRTATEGKHQFFTAEQREIKELKKNLKQTHEDAMDVSDGLKALVLYRRAGQYELEKQIGLLKSKLQDTQEDFEDEKRILNERFTKTKQKFADNLDAHLENTKVHASDTAIAGKGPRAMSVYEDHDWLSREIKAHEEEAIRLEYSCSRLEEENVMMLRGMVTGADEDDRWASVENYKRHGEQVYESESGESSDGSRSGNDRSFQEEEEGDVFGAPARRANQSFLPPLGTTKRGTVKLPQLVSLDKGDARGIAPRRRSSVSSLPAIQNALASSQKTGDAGNTILRRMSSTSSTTAPRRLGSTAR